MSQPPDDTPTLDPGLLIPRLTARYQLQLSRQQEEIGRLIDEIAHLEAFVAQIHAQLTEERSTRAQQGT
jgi:hypothetical protein